MAYCILSICVFDLVDGKWVDGECSTTCGTGIQIRMNGTEREERNCTNNQACPGNKNTDCTVLFNFIYTMHVHT